MAKIIAPSRPRSGTTRPKTKTLLNKCRRFVRYNCSGICIAFQTFEMHNCSLVGRITVVQEQRFRLTADDGRTFLFILDRKSPVPLPAVYRLPESHTLVRIEYSGEPNTSSGIAHVVQPTRVRGAKKWHEASHQSGKRRYRVCPRRHHQLAQVSTTASRPGESVFACLWQGRAFHAH